MSTVKALKEIFDKFQASISVSLNEFENRVATIEGTILNEIVQEPSTISPDSVDAILEKIEIKGNEISAKNETSNNEIKNDILEIRDVIIKHLVEENRKLRSRAAVFESRIIEIERRMNRGDQHSRKVNFEIDGIPQSVEQGDLKATAVKIFKEAGVDPVSEENIELIHRLNSRRMPQPTILKARRDFIERVFEKKREITNVGEKVGFDEGVKLYVNHNLCPAFNNIAYNCRLLKR